MLKIPAFCIIIKFIILYITNSLYLPKNIKVVLKQVFSKERSILDFLYTISIGIYISLPITTIDSKLSCYIFTNYNRVRKRKDKSKSPKLSGIFKLPS